MWQSFRAIVRGTSENEWRKNKAKKKITSRVKYKPVRNGCFGRPKKHTWNPHITHNTAWWDELGINWPSVEWPDRDAVDWSTVTMTLGTYRTPRWRHWSTTYDHPTSGQNHVDLVVWRTVRETFDWRVTGRHELTHCTTVWCTDTQTYRQTYSNTDTQTYRQTYSNTDTQTQTQTDILTVLIDNSDVRIVFFHFESNRIE